MATSPIPFQYSSSPNSQPLNRDPLFVFNFREWIQNGDRVRMLNQMKETYESSFFGFGDARCEISRTANHSVFLLHYQFTIDPTEFYFLMDHIQQVLMNNEYVNYMSDIRKTRVDNESIRTIQRHYLKPGSVFDGISSEGKFGNVSVEVSSDNEVPEFLKISCSFPGGKTQNRELAIDKLMEKILLTD